MIRCQVIRREGRILRFSIEGHAGFAEFGKDVVCAAVSVLTTNAINSSEALLGFVPKVEETKDTLKCELLGCDSKDVQLLFQSMLFGLNEIAKFYPKHLKVHLVEAKE